MANILLTREAVLFKLRLKKTKKKWLVNARIKDPSGDGSLTAPETHGLVATQGLFGCIDQPLRMS